jgi:hypothetical protein
VRHPEIKGATEINSSWEMVWLRDFSWQYFTLTGDIDAYLLYKQHQDLEPVELDGSVDGEEQTGNTES